MATADLPPVPSGDIAERTVFARDPRDSRTRDLFSPPPLVAAPISPPTNSAPLPEAVRTRIGQAIATLRLYGEQLRINRAADDRLGGDGRYEAEAAQAWADRVRHAQDDLQEFRRLAPDNGVDAEGVIASLGGISDTELSARATDWLTHRKEGDGRARTPSGVQAVDSTSSTEPEAQDVAAKQFAIPLADDSADRPPIPAMLQDAGEKIGGARKDRWAEAGMRLADLDGLTNGEAAKFVTKDAVWPKPDYASLVEQGMPPKVAALVKIVRDRLAARPSKDTPEGRRAYVEMLGHVRDAFEAARTEGDLSAARNTVIYEKLGWPRGSSLGVRPTAEQTALLFSIMKGRSEALGITFSDRRKADALVGSGFPGEPEHPWLKGVELRDVEGYGTIIRRSGKHVRSGLADQTAAKDWLRQEWEARYQKGDSSDGPRLPARPHLDNLRRTGADVRQGRDVTGQDFLDDFDFRGIEFGNWVASDERQKSVNLAYEALHDLASITGLSPKALSLGGQLGLAFGARGSGSALAHYEPAKLVINVTKLRGAGTLAHELAHALDHYFGEFGRPDAYQGRARGASGWYDGARQYDGKPLRRYDPVTRRPVEELRLPNLRPELAMAFDRVMDALHQRPMSADEERQFRERSLERAKSQLASWERHAGTVTGKAAREAQESISMWQRIAATAETDLAAARVDGFIPTRRTESSFFKNAKALSGKAGDEGYWARPTEMFARALEAYVFDRLRDRGDRSDYLVHGVEATRYASDAYRGNPYPAGDEREQINAAFDHLFTTIDERIAENGQTVLFSREAGDDEPSLSEMAPLTIPPEVVIPPAGAQIGDKWSAGGFRMHYLAPDLVSVGTYRSADQTRVAEVEASVSQVATVIAPYATLGVLDTLYDIGGPDPVPVAGATFGRRNADGDLTSVVIVVSARSTNPIGALVHEALHYVKRTECLTNDEYATLDQACEPWIAAFGIEDLYSRDLRDAHREEAVAFGVAEFYRTQWADSHDVAEGRGRRGKMDSAAPSPAAQVTYSPDVGAIISRILSGEVGHRYPDRGVGRESVLRDDTLFARDPRDVHTFDMFESRLGATTSSGMAAPDPQPDDVVRPHIDLPSARIGPDYDLVKLAQSAKIMVNDGANGSRPVSLAFTGMKDGNYVFAPAGRKSREVFAFPETMLRDIVAGYAFPFGGSRYIEASDKPAVTSNSPEMKPPSLSPIEHRYGAFNRPAGHATVPPGYIRIEPRPDRGVDLEGWDVARHGIVVYDRKLKADEIRDFELVPFLVGDDRATLVNEIAEVMSEYRDRYLDVAERQPEVIQDRVRTSLRQRFTFGAHVGDVQAFAADVLGYLAADRALEQAQNASRPDSDAALLDGFPIGSHFINGRGALASHKWGVADATGHLIWNLHDTKAEAAGAARGELGRQARVAAAAQAADAAFADISTRLLDGGQLTDADIRTLGLKIPAGFEWLSPVAQRLFGISRAKVRESMGDALRSWKTDGGTVHWRADPRQALANAAAYINSTADNKNSFARDPVSRPAVGPDLAPHIQGQWSPLDSEFEAFRAARPGVPVSEVARDFVLQEGEGRGGVEILVVIEQETGRVLAAGTQHDPIGVIPPGDGRSWTTPVDVHHNHEHGLPLSEDDIAWLASRNMPFRVLAHTPSAVSVATINLATAGSLSSSHYRRTFHGLVCQAGIMMASDPEVSAAIAVMSNMADQFTRDIALQAMAAMHLISYDSTHTFGVSADATARLVELVRSAIESPPDADRRDFHQSGELRGGAAAADAGGGNSPGDGVSTDQSPDSILVDGEVGSVPGGAGEHGADDAQSSETPGLPGGGGSFAGMAGQPSGESALLGSGLNAPSTSVPYDPYGYWVFPDGQVTPCAVAAHVESACEQLGLNPDHELADDPNGDNNFNIRMRGVDEGAVRITVEQKGAQLSLHYTTPTAFAAEGALRVMALFPQAQAQREYDLRPVPMSVVKAELRDWASFDDEDSMDPSPPASSGPNNFARSTWPAPASIPLQALTPPAGIEPGASWRYGRFVMHPLGTSAVGVEIQEPDEEARAHAVLTEIAIMAERMTPYATVEVYGGIFDIAGATPQEVSGTTFARYDYDDGIGDIVVAVSAVTEDPAGILAHESVHYLQRTECLTDDEYTTLAGDAADWTDRYDIVDRYRDDPSSTHRDEAIAHAFADYQRYLRHDGAGIAGRSGDGAEAVAGSSAQHVGPSLSADVIAIFDRIDAGEVGRRYPERGLDRNIVLRQMPVAFKRDAHDDRTFDMFAPTAPRHPAVEPRKPTAPPIPALPEAPSSFSSGTPSPQATPDVVPLAGADHPLLLADQQTYERALWDAMQRRWQSGKDVVYNTMTRVTVISPRNSSSMRLERGRLQQYVGPRTGWQTLGPIGQPIDTLAVNLGMPTSFDRTSAQVAVQQAADAQRFAVHIQIAADSIEDLRPADVYRVIEEIGLADREDLADWLRQERPDLIAEVDDVMAEIGPKDLPTEAQIRFQLDHRLGDVGQEGSGLAALNAANLPSVLEAFQVDGWSGDDIGALRDYIHEHRPDLFPLDAGASALTPEEIAARNEAEPRPRDRDERSVSVAGRFSVEPEDNEWVVVDMAAVDGGQAVRWWGVPFDSTHGTRRDAVLAAEGFERVRIATFDAQGALARSRMRDAASITGVAPPTPPATPATAFSYDLGARGFAVFDDRSYRLVPYEVREGAGFAVEVVANGYRTTLADPVRAWTLDEAQARAIEDAFGPDAMTADTGQAPEDNDAIDVGTHLVEERLAQRPLGLTMDAIATRLGYGGWTSSLTPDQIVAIETVFEVQEMGPPEYSNRLETLSDQIDAVPAADTDRRRELEQERDHLQDRRAASYLLTGDELRAFVEQAATAADAPAAAVVPSPIDGAQSPPVPTLSSYVPPDGWRSSLAKARDYAQALGIPSQGKDLEALAGDIAITTDTGRVITRMDQISAQESAKRGLEIAVIGGIGVQFVGTGEEAKRQLTAAFASIGGKVEQLRAADPAMVIEVEPTSMVDLLIPPRAEMDEAIRARVEKVRELLPQVGGPDFNANRLLTEAAERGMNIERTMVVASSVAALDGETVVRRIHAAEALSYHSRQAPVIDAALATDKMSVPTSAAPDANGLAYIDGRFAGILTGRLIDDVTASFHAQLPGWPVEVTGFDQIRASGLINGEVGAIQYEAGRYVAIGETGSGFGTIHAAPSLDVLLADIGEMFPDRASLAQMSNSSVKDLSSNAAGDLIVAVREVLDQADVVLEPAGTIDDAIVRFTGAIKGAKDAPGYLGGAWHEGLLEDAFSTAPSAKGIELRDTLADAFTPVRDRIRAITGDTVTLYRHNQVGPLADRDRNVLSWTLSQRVAATFAGWGGRAPQPVKDSDIETALAEYERDSRVSFAGRQYVRNEAEPAYYDILDRDGDVITDGDDLRADLLSVQADRQEMIALYQERMARVVAAQVPLSEVVWATDRAGQMEFIVRNRDEDGYRLAKDGSVRLPPQWRSSLAALMPAPTLLQLQQEFDADQRFRVLRESATVVDLSQPLLVVVHPGSLMGSYAMHYADYGGVGAGGWQLTDPTALREQTAAAIAEWDGDTVLISGDFSDEIDGVLADTLNTTCRTGTVVISGPDDHYLAAAAQWIADSHGGRHRSRVVVVGAWGDSTHGCAHAVASSLRDIGCAAVLSELVPYLDEPPTVPTTSRDIPGEVSKRFSHEELAANPHIAARLDVLARGAADGNAHVVAFDAAGRRYDATDSDPRMVALPVGVAPALADPFENVTVHYNRVNGAGPNNADLEALALPGLSRVVLHTETQQFHLELSPAMREWCRHTGDTERSIAVIDALWSAIQVPLRVHTKALVRQGQDERAVQARVSHTACAALAQSGLVLYDYTLPTEPLMDTVVLADIVRVAAIKEGLNVAHTDPGQLSAPRSVSGAMAELARHHEIASGSGQSPSPARDSESGSRGGPATAGSDRSELTGAAGSELRAVEFPTPANEPPVLDGEAPDRSLSDVLLPLVDEPASPIPTSSASFAIGSQGDLAPASQGAKVETNLAALIRLKALDASGARATDDDRRVLARYSGWGHSPQIFDDANTTGTWPAHRAALRGLLTDAEFAAARLTTLNAHYTSHEVITSIWQAAQGLGFPGGRVLEPGCGIGNFVGAMPPALSARTGVVGVELDPTTAAIARHLYPTAEIRAEGFETTKLPAAGFDMAIGNVPFGKIVLHDPEHNRGGHSIHNHFILKSLALAKPGAIVAMVTSRYTMDARNIAARRDIAEQADLLGAVRLPETAFKASAGTEAVTDILFLRKRFPGEEPTDQSWVGTSPLATTGTSGGLAASAEGGQDLTTAVYINNYFIQHPDHVLGSMVVEQGMYNANTFTVKPNPGPLAEQIAGATASIVTVARDVGRTWAAIQTGTSAEGALPPPQPVAPASIKEGAFYVDDDGAIKIRENGYGVDARVPAGDRAEVVALIALRDTVHQILDIQSRDLSGISTGEDEATPPWADAQAKLNTLYDDYFARFGPINRFTPIARGVDDNGEEVFARRYPKMGGFRRDADFASVIALEVFDDEHQTSAKAAVFSRRVLNAPREIRGADDAQGALLAVLEATGRVDLPRMAELLATDQAAVIAELKGAIFQEPATRAWVTADEYLSGNVRVKLRDADAAADLDPTFVENVEALRKVQPRDLAPRDIVARLGAPWIPASDVQDFVREIMEADDVSVDYAGLINAWGVRAPSKVSRSPLSRTVWGTTRRDAITLLTDALNGSPTVVYDQTRDGGRVKNPRATLDACEKREKLTEKFSTWLWQDLDRATRLAAIYNEQFNSMVLRSFDGSHLRFPGLSAAITPRQHQRNVAWRVVQDGNTLMAHAVGAGKTLGSILSSMEEKRLGLVNKPAFVVPNHMLEQFAREFKQAYPAARLLLADKDAVSPESRKAFVAKCAMGDWDAVIFTHNTFGAIPVSVAAQSAFIQQEVEELEAAIAAAKDEDDRRPTIKRLEVARKNRVERIKSLLASENKDDGLTFEQTGIDRVYVDEVHLFKNLGFVTSRPGVSAPASQRATDLFIKTEILEQKTPGRSIVGMSGTPIANRVAEMYVNQRYFDREGLVAMGISHFDAWASTFGEDVTAVELAPDGATFRLSTRFAKYNNVPELLTHFRSFTDVQTADMLNLPVPEIKGGKPQVVTIPATDLQKAYIKSIQERMEKIRNREVEPQEDNMLKVTGDGRKAAADMRLLGFPAETAGSKADIVGGQIARIYQETKDFEFPVPSMGQVSPNRGALQLVFCDLGTPKKDGSFSMYEAIRESAIANGVPANQIRFIHDYPTDTAKARLFADCRAGRVAALFGSTDKMGVGTNVQDRLYAVHHVDCPWRPVDIEQRDGRKDRQGNLHYDLGIPTETLIYGTEGTFDVYMWQAAERKARFIGQIMKGDLEAREIEDIDGQALSYAEAKAILTGNPILMEKAGIDAEVAKLQRAARNHTDEQHTLRSTIATSVRVIGINEREIEMLSRLQPLVQPLVMDAFKPAAVVPRPPKIDLTPLLGEHVAEGGAPLLEGAADSASTQDPISLINSPGHYSAVQAAAGKALLRAVTDEWAQSRLTARGFHRHQIGQFAGLPLSLETGGTLGADTVRVCLADHPRLTIDIEAPKLGKTASGVPHIQALHRLVTGIPSDIAFYVDNIEERKTAIVQAEAALGKPFPQEALLDAKRTRQSEIAAQLAIDTPIAGLDMVSDAAGDAVESEPTDESDQPAESLDDERLTFDPRDSRSYEAGFAKGRSFFYGQVGGGIARFETTPFCRELGRAADSGNRARALGLAHAVMSIGAQYVREAAGELSKKGYGSRDSYRGKEAGREFLAAAAATEGWGSSMSAAEIRTAEGSEQWLASFDHTMAAAEIVKPGLFADHHHVRTLMDALVQKDSFALGAMSAIDGLPPLVREGRSNADIAAAIAGAVVSQIGELVETYVKNPSSYIRDRYYDFAGATQRSVIDALPTDEDRRHYQNGHAALIAKREDIRRTYRNSNYYTMPPSIAPAGAGVVDAVRAAAATLGASGDMLNAGARTGATTMMLQAPSAAELSLTGLDRHQAAGTDIDPSETVTGRYLALVEHSTTPDSILHPFPFYQQIADQLVTARVAHHMQVAVGDVGAADMAAMIEGLEALRTTAAQHVMRSPDARTAALEVGILDEVGAAASGASEQHSRPVYEERDEDQFAYQSA